MAQDNHTPLSTGAAAQAATFNSVFSSLDSAIKKNNYAATAAPTTGDDTADGYTVGSRWIDVTNDRAYVAVDVTLGAAVWKEISVPATITTAITFSSTVAINSTLIVTHTSDPAVRIKSTEASGAGSGGALRLEENDGAAMASGDRLGYLDFAGSDDASNTIGQGAAIESFAAENFSATAHGAHLDFATVPVTTTSRTRRMRIDSQGNVVIGTAAIATNATDGFYYISTSAGAPSGTPTTHTGRAPIHLDTTNGRVYFYYGGAWHYAALT